jgi:D-alanyl-D-alanine endopeptidase (penicillin-binding protein 7)
MKLLLNILLFMAIGVQAKPIESYVLYDADNHSVVTGTNIHEVKPVASLTKLMTAMVAIDLGIDNRELLERLLIRSDNTAADLLASHHPQGKKFFIQAMNAKAQQLGLMETTYHDPSGLSVFNRSTAREYVEVVIAANTYPLIREISSTPEKRIGSKKKYQILHNTNSLLREFDEIVVSKTGFTSHAGRCLALFVENQTKKHIIVILGEPTPQKRSEIARNLIRMTH